MTVTISQQTFWDLFVEIPEVKKTCNDIPSTVVKCWDIFDTISYFPKELGQGFCGEIELRNGLYLAISEHQLNDDLIIKLPERQHPLEYSFYLAGDHQDKNFHITNGQNRLWGSGLAPKEKYKSFKSGKIIEINVHMEPELFCFFMGKERNLRGDKMV